MGGLRIGVSIAAVLFFALLWSWAESDPSADATVKYAVLGFVAAGLVLVLQWRNRWLRAIGFTVLLWIPCVIANAAVLTVAGLGGWPAGGGRSGATGFFLLLFGLPLLESSAISFLVFPWLGKRWGRTGEHKPSGSSGL